jgi:hypothetical protein
MVSVLLADGAEGMWGAISFGINTKEEREA